MDSTLEDLVCLEPPLNSKKEYPERIGSTASDAASLISTVDLFCGVGGLTNGLAAAGIPVMLGVDIDPACNYPYSTNNDAEFLLKSVDDLTVEDFPKSFFDSRVKLLAGCAPCQPFSTYSRARSTTKPSRWTLLEHYSRLVKESRPHLVTMENVPPLRHEEVFADFVSVLESEGFRIQYSVVNCANYGVPQRRQRLVLLASRLGPIKLILPTIQEGSYKTVRDAIAHMPPLRAGEICQTDPLHQAAPLSPLNLKRIRASKPGGTWRDWEVSLRTACHLRKTGASYPSVYGRMTWDDPAPTVTTQYFGFGNGRFGHPDQDRAISLREGALLQSFPKTYAFVPAGEPVRRKHVGRLIGNAVPVNLGVAIGKSIARHVENWLHSRTSSRSNELHV